MIMITKLALNISKKNDLKQKIFLFIFLPLSFILVKNSYSIELNIFVCLLLIELEYLGDNISKTEKIEKLKEVALETVDIKGIGFYTLGKHRKT